MALRDFARRLTPRAGHEAARRLKDLVAGPGIETVVLGAYRLEPVAVAGPRLTLIAPSIAARGAFGGVATGVELVLRLVAAFEPARRPALRVLSEDGAPAQETILPDLADRLGIDAARVEFGRVGPGAAVELGPDDLVLCYNWWTLLNALDLLAAQAARFDRSPAPLYYLCQDYEPGFYPYSSAHLLASQAYAPDWPLRVAFNSSELAAHFHRMGGRADRTFVFEPRLPLALRPWATGLERSEKERLILAYARPGVPRNCFSILREALTIWAREGRAREGWSVVSAGAAHRAVALGGGKRIEPLGKLSLDAYGALLRRTAVGVSLMCSPHPSYPPLEMAWFGARVVSNGYADKDLSRRHGAIVSVRDARPAALAAAIDAQCAAFDADPHAPPAPPSPAERYLDDDGFDCLDALAGDMAEAWGRP